MINRAGDGVRLCEGDTLLACVGPELAPKRFPEDIAAVFRSAETDAPAGST